MTNASNQPFTVLYATRVRNSGGRAGRIEPIPDELTSNAESLGEDLGVTFTAYFGIGDEIGALLASEDGSTIEPELEFGTGDRRWVVRVLPGSTQECLLLLVLNKAPSARSCGELLLCGPPVSCSSRLHPIQDSETGDGRVFTVGEEELAAGTRTHVLMVLASFGARELQIAHEDDDYRVVSAANGKATPSLRFDRIERVDSEAAEE